MMFKVLIGCSIIFHATHVIEGSVLPHTYNKFGDAVVKVSSEYKEFKESLKESLHTWYKNGCEGVWLTFSMAYAHYSCKALELGFTVHHANDREIVLTKWLSDGEESKLKPYATHTVGIAACVIDEHNNILVVKEKDNPSWGYRLPSGGVNPSESIQEAAIRETKEETGIDTHFIEILGFCERHNAYADGITDLYVLCRLSPLTRAITIQESEILEARWMPYDDFKESAQDILPIFMAINDTSSCGLKSYALLDPLKHTNTTMLYAQSGWQRSLVATIK